MKSILAYGQTIQRRNSGKADNLSVYHAGIQAVKDGYNVKAFERITLPSGIVAIRKVKGE